LPNGKLRITNLLSSQSFNAVPTAPLAAANLILNLCLLLVLGCSGLNQPGAGEHPWVPVKLAKAVSVAHLTAQLPLRAIERQKGKIIFIGVQGGNPLPLDDAAHFDPQQWPAYHNVDLDDEAQLNRIAYHESVMHVIALYITRKYPGSVSLIMRGDSVVVTDLLDAIYTAGDTIFLAGHSFGGGVIEEVVKEYRRRNIPIALLAYIESFWSAGVVPNNVKRAVNFYVPAVAALCPGQRRIHGEDESATILINVPIADPKGPYRGFCAGHRNIDSEPRVWKPLLELALEAAAS
jgi:hypothetical protein